MLHFVHQGTHEEQATAILALEPVAVVGTEAHRQRIESISLIRYVDDEFTTVDFRGDMHHPRLLILVPTHYRICQRFGDGDRDIKPAMSSGEASAPA